MCELETPSPAEPNAQKSPSFQLSWIDYWLLFVVEIAALLGMYISIFGIRITLDSFVFIYFGPALVYAALTAAVAVTVPRKVSLPVLPIFESWRAGSLTIRKIVSSVIVAALVGTIASYAALCYEQALIEWLGGGFSRRHVATSAPGLVCTAILEEILFRAGLFPLLAVAIRWAWEQPDSCATTIPVWIGNLLQALLFGAAHIAVGRGSLHGRPWYIQIPLVSQTWSGLILGCVYLRYGIETVIVCHATFDLLLLALARGVIRVPRI